MTLLFASILLFYGELDDEDESGELVLTSVGDPDELVIEFSCRLFDASLWSWVRELFEGIGLVYLDEDEVDEDGEREAAADVARLGSPFGLV